MAKPTTVATEVARFRQSIDEMLRSRVRDAIEIVLDEELTEALGSGRHDRTSTRAGHRNRVFGAFVQRRVDAPLRSGDTGRAD